jgi:hypothetical protein
VPQHMAEVRHKVQRPSSNGLVQCFQQGSPRLHSTPAAQPPPAQHPRLPSVPSMLPAQQHHAGVVHIRAGLGDGAAIFQPDCARARWLSRAAPCRPPAPLRQRRGFRSVARAGAAARRGAGWPYTVADIKIAVYTY